MLNILIAKCPLVTLSVDGLAAKVCYNGMRFQSDEVGGTRIQGGIYENEYVFMGDSWKISLLHYYPFYACPFTGGWRNVGAIVSYHFIPDEAGIPIPPPIGDAQNITSTLDQRAQRITRLNNEEAVRNLQHAYGYYASRRI